MAFILALLATPILLVVAAMCSPEWYQRDQILAALQQKANFDTPQGRYVLGLIPFGIFLGMPAALGLIEPANVLTILGGMVACMVGHSCLADQNNISFTPLNASHGWFVAVSWAVMAMPLYAGSFSLTDSMALQAVLGPAPLTATPGAAGLWIALLAGIVAAAGWASSLPKLSGPYGAQANQAADFVSRWGATALAATAVSAVTFGPSLGALAAGPADGGAAANVAISFSVTLAAVALASYIRRFVDQVPAIAAATGAGMFTLVGMVAAAFVK